MGQFWSGVSIFVRSPTIQENPRLRNREADYGAEIEPKGNKSPVAEIDDMSLWALAW